ncbi:MAG: hypothetical protein HYY90_00865 [Candidatus Omnitrophica bacterium]|nr:hypothetical protein [Candidatus Omnitrophota bacterium]
MKGDHLMQPMSWFRLSLNFLGVVAALYAILFGSIGPQLLQGAPVSTQEAASIEEVLGSFSKAIQHGVGMNMLVGATLFACLATGLLVMRFRRWLLVIDLLLLPYAVWWKYDLGIPSFVRFSTALLDPKSFNLIFDLFISGIPVYALVTLWVLTRPSTKGLFR